MTEARFAACVDGVPADAVPLDDRGLAYGDGLFETVLLHQGRPVWWQAHLARLARGAAVLGIDAPSADTWLAELHRLLGRLDRPPPRAVLKLILTRGGGRRGYAVEPEVPPRRILQLLPAPPDRPEWRRDGIAVRWCELRLAEQPRLAGLKHLNRLEQVLARAEWSGSDIVEGLLCRADGAVVSALAANLFVVSGGTLLTPFVDRCGVAGICREVLRSHCEAVEARLTVEQVMAADELVLCNSVRGILPVGRVDARSFEVGPVTRSLIARLAAAEPAFAFEAV